MWWGRASDEAEDDEDDTWVVRLTIGHRTDVPMEIEGVRDEADCIETVKAWLLNLNEDGSPPRDWDGWLELDYHECGQRTRLVFQPQWITGFTVSRGPIADQ